MKNTLCKIMAVLFIAATMISSLAGCGDRATELWIYNWGDYMDPDVISGFSAWYEGETGERVKVMYRTFDTNESMYESVITKNGDWDLICPSDYMIERIIKEGKAQKIDKDIVNVEELIDPFLLEIIDSLSGDPEKPASDYTIPYVWGTFGIMYDSTVLTKDDVNSWSALWNDDYSGEIWMKKSVRDAYAVASLYARRGELSSASNEFTQYGNSDYQRILSEIFTVYDEGSIALAEEALILQKSKLHGYEVDNGKTEMHAGNGNLGLFWSCDAGFVMNDMELPSFGCFGGGTDPGNKNLFYTVPEEGSNIWIDGWLIPENAKNTKAANYFLKYLMEGELDGENVSILNAQYAGAPTPCFEAMEDYYKMLDEDADGFFEDAPEGFKEMHMEMMFPSVDVLKRCAVMKDFGSEYQQAMTDMWNRVMLS